MEETASVGVKPQKRYWILSAGMLMQFCAGIIYLWSVFKVPVAVHLNWDAGYASLTSSIMLVMFVLGIISGGLVQDKLGPRKTTLAGSIFISAGIICTAFISATTPWLVYLTYGIIAGFGVGTVYTTTIATIQKWFPDKRGFASGMIICAFGLSLVAFAPLANYLLAKFGVPSTFLFFGIGFFVICTICSCFIKNPGTGYMPAKAAVKAAAKAAVKATAKAAVKAADVGIKDQYSPKEILKTKQYYLLAAGILFTLPAYFILNPVFISLGTVRSLSNELAVLGVALTGISSAAGRLIVAWSSDKIGRKTAMAVAAIIILISSLIMISANGILFLICIMLIAFGFGGTISVYSVMTTECFGTKNSGMNFGLVMIGFGISALVFPLISKKLNAGGSFTSSLILAALSCIIAIVLVMLMKNPAIKNIKSEERNGTVLE